jgi:hypothetical protein
MNSPASASTNPAKHPLLVPPISESEKVITAEVTMDTGVCLHGERVKCGEIAKITIQQWRALSRHFRFIDGPASEAPAAWEPKSLPSTTRTSA